MSDRPVAEVVARIVGRHLGDAARALDRDDAEALHAFRVALRRARATLRAFREWLPEVRRKDRRRLRDLARTTNAGRDAEVLLPLLARLAGELAPAERAEVARLRRQLRRKRASAWPARLGELRTALRVAARPLRRRLAREPASPASFGEALGALLAEDARRLRAEIETLRTSDAPDAFHAARLTVKRSRYLLEPVRRAVRGAAVLVRDLAGLQTDLGDLHDLDVLAALVRAEMTGREAAGLAALGRVIAAHRAALAGRVRHEWVDGRGPSLASDIAATARTLGGSRAAARRTTPAPR